MKHYIVLMSCFLLIILTSPTEARVPDESSGLPAMVEIAGPSDMINSQTTADKTDYLIYSEDFESGEGGWTSHDVSVKEAHWQISDFNAANLDPTTGNHAWWCGARFYPCEEGEEAVGYGNDWDSRLEWRGDVVGAPSSVLVQITATLNVDLEEDFDYLHLEYYQATGWTNIESWHGVQQDIQVDQSRYVYSTDFVDDQILLRWRVVSDTYVSPADCNWTGTGAAQIDNIAVFFNGVQQGSIETCEPGDESVWVPVDKPGSGDFAQLWDNPLDLETCDDNANHSHRWVFVDDGLVVPGTGGYAGTPGNDYFESGWVVNPEGGLLGPGNDLWNEVWSPLIPWDTGVGNGGKVSYEMYVHVPYGQPNFPGIFQSHRIRSTSDPLADPAVDPELWTPWREMNNFIYVGGPYNRHYEFDISRWLVEDCAQVQVALGVKQLGGYNTGTENTTPGPYFDNVELTRHDEPFVISAYFARDLAQDAFPVDFSITPQASHSVRFDSARDLDPEDSEPEFQDFLVARFFPCDAEVANPILHYEINPNPLYDSFRSLDGDYYFTGTFTAGSTITTGGVYGEYDHTNSSGQQFYQFDLPDEGFLFPGDVMHYYFEAAPGFTTLPEDITGFSDFTSTSPYYETYTWRALPSLNASGEIPRVLLWNDSRLVDDGNDWPEALIATGFSPGVGFDTYRTTSAWNNQRNGLGYNRLNNVFQSYETIIYCGGDLDNDPLEDWDIGTLWSFIHSNTEDHSLILAGNHTISALDAHPMGWGEYLLGPSDGTLGGLGVRGDGSDVGAATLMQDQSVFALAGNAVFDDGDNWVADGSCPSSMTFDAVTLDGAESLAEFAPVGTLPYTAASRYTFTNNQSVTSTTFVFPYDLSYIDDGSKAGDKNILRMSSILEDIFISLDYGPVPCFLQACDFTVAGGTVEASWLVSGTAQTESFRLEASGPGGTRVVPHASSAENRFTALDDSPLLQVGGTFVYTLYYCNAADIWQTIQETEVKVGDGVPLVTKLVGAFPNPFNPQTEIAFSLDRKQMVDVSVYDLSGRQIITLASDPWDAGHHTVVWKGTDESGRRVSSGTYFVQMKTADKVESEKIMLVK